MIFLLLCLIGIKTCKTSLVKTAKRQHFSLIKMQTCVPHIPPHDPAVPLCSRATYAMYISVKLRHRVEFGGGMVGVIEEWSIVALSTEVIKCVVGSKGFTTEASATYELI